MRCRCYRAATANGGSAKSGSKDLISSGNNFSLGKAMMFISSHQHIDLSITLILKKICSLSFTVNCMMIVFLRRQFIHNKTCTYVLQRAEKNGPAQKKIKKNITNTPHLLNGTGLQQRRPSKHSPD